MSEHAESWRHAAAALLDRWLDDPAIGEIQDILVSAGLLHEVVVTEPCGESCGCAWCDFPVACYRLTEAGKAARRSKCWPGAMSLLPAWAAYRIHDWWQRRAK